MSNRTGRRAVGRTVGQRVEIVALAHPWVGRFGHIVELFKGHSALDWVVELEGSDGNYPGQRVAVAEWQIRSAPRGI